MTSGHTSAATRPLTMVTGATSHPSTNVQKAPVTDPAMYPLIAPCQVPFLVVESGNQSQALIEERLRQLRAGRDRMGVGTEALEQLSALTVPGFVVSVLRRRKGNGERNGKQESLHLPLPETGYLQPKVTDERKTTVRPTSERVKA